MTAKVLYDKRGEVAHITLNRPEVKNAIDIESHDGEAALGDRTDQWQPDIAEPDHADAGVAREEPPADRRHVDGVSR